MAALIDPDTISSITLGEAQDNTSFYSYISCSFTNFLVAMVRMAALHLKNVLDQTLVTHEVCSTETMALIGDSAVTRMDTLCNPLSRAMDSAFQVSFKADTNVPES